MAQKLEFLFQTKQQQKKCNYIFIIILFIKKTYLFVCLTTFVIIY